MRKLLLISYRFPPETYPLAISLDGVVRHLSKSWEVDVVTAAEGTPPMPNLRVHRVPPRSNQYLHRLLGRVRLDKLAHLLTWPDPFRPWVAPALEKATELVSERQHDAALVFMMPFSTGFVGTALKARTGIPLVMNLDDSPTCSDMHPTYPSRLHYIRSQRMENAFIQGSDRVVYVSETNRNRIAASLDAVMRDRVKVVRCSAEPPDLNEAARQEASRRRSDGTFRIVYTGAMTGWYDLDPRPASLAKRVFQVWERLGQYKHASLDRRTHSPVFVGKAVKQIFEAHPEWVGRIQIDVYGNTYPEAITRRVLDEYGVTDIVNLHGRIPPDEVPHRTAEASLLFLALPDRPDGTPGGRISLKTYEYVMTNRPILAAVPPGENRAFLQSVDGVFLTEPTGVSEMAASIESLAARQFAGKPTSINRPQMRAAFDSSARADALSSILCYAARLPAGNPVAALS